MPDDTPEAVLVAVHDDAVEELVAAGLVTEIPTLRGPAIEAAAVIGVHAGAIVTLMQTPGTVRAFAEWITATARRRDGMEVTARRGGRRVRLEVSGDVPVEAVTKFLIEALGDADNPDK